MQDPSYGVPQQLVQHVHLISSHKYPYIPHMGIDVAFHYLFEAPKIVKQLAPMSWQYLNAPQDGTVFLTWQSSRTANQFPTDGYVWAGQEEHLMQDFGGYTIEVAIYSSGFRPGIDQMSCHARRRYRLISKNPQVAAVPPDTSLWIVHYSQSEPHKVLPIQHVHITPLIQHQIQERRLIEQQGRLERQDFMLHDREKWPQLRMPGRGVQPGQMYGQNHPGQNPMAHIGNPRFSGQFYQQPQQGMAGPSPAKRQRQHPPSQMLGPAVAATDRDTSIEDDENMLVGDFLDFLTHRDISLTRYVQHHEWMEEVFSSPYATEKIVPVDLGFGLMGELSGLTEGIFETVASAQDKALANTDRGSANPTKIKPEQLQDFEKRVNEHLEKGQAELQRMKDEHVKRMEDFKRGKTLSRAEKRLRNATWESESVGAEGAEGRADGHSRDNVESVISEVENLLGVTIQTKEEAALLEKGGLREKIRPPPEVQASVVNGDNETMQDVEDIGQHVLDSHASGPSSLTSAPMSRQPSAAAPAAAAPPQLQAQMAPVATSDPQVRLQQQGPTAQHDTTIGDLSGLDSIGDISNIDNMESLGPDMSLIEDMDLDVEDADLSFDAAESSEQRPEQQQQQQQQQTDWNPNRPQHVSNIDDNNNNNNAPPQPLSNASLPTPNANDALARAGDESELFGADQSAFDELDGGDGLIDFEGGDVGDDLELDLGMDGSAFGDAFHAHETPEEHGGGGGVGGGSGGNGGGLAGEGGIH